jgi:hypothetical protein
MCARCGWLLAVLAFAGCASGGGSGDDVTTRRDSGPPDLSSPSSCEPACVAPEMCVAGACVDPGDDADMDGIPASQDCDDSNGAVGRMAERTCSGDCGSGVEQCSDGVWGSCSAPTECDCSDGDPPREIACPGCGTQQQVCMGGVWVDDGACVTTGDGCTPGESRGGASCGMCGTASEICDLSCTWVAGACEGETGECMPGEIDEEMESCGGCGDGTRTRTRSCGAGCSWGAWGAWGACSSGSGSGECTPGMTDTETRGCGNCGTETRTRNCTDTCTWGSWSSWSCSGEGACAPGETRDCSGTSASGCVHEVCTSSCTWSGCQLKPGNGCNHTSDSGVAGGRYRCCGSNSWQFCLPSCQWSSACESGCGCGC